MPDIILAVAPGLFFGKHIFQIYDCFLLLFGVFKTTAFAWLTHKSYVKHSEITGQVQICSNYFCVQSARTRRRTRRMKTQRLSTESARLWSGKTKFAVVQSPACPLHRLAPVTRVGQAPTHLWSSQTMKRSMPTLCCWPLFPKPGMKRQRRRRKRRDALLLNLHKQWISGRNIKSQMSLHLHPFLFGEIPSMVNLAVICCFLLIVKMFLWIPWTFLYS